MDGMRLNERSLRTSFTETEYISLMHFFQDIWSSDAAYKVFMARRAFNLNFAFMNIMSAQYKNEYNIEGVMTNTALLLCAKDIASYYRLTKDFPKIIIADDLLIHGRGVMKLIDNLEQLISSFLGDPQTYTKHIIHNKLIDTITIYVYAQNIDSILLDKCFSLRSVKRMPSRELRAFSQKVSRALQQCGVANTSYVLSGELPWDFCRQEYNYHIDKNSLFPYRGNTLRYYYRSSKNKILETVRTYCSGWKSNAKNIATSLVIFGDIPYHPNDLECKFDKLCQEVGELIRKFIPLSRMAAILDYKNICFVRPKAQMLSFLLSIFCYCDFYRENISDSPHTIYKALLQSDYQKIASNFGPSKKFQFEIIQLFSYVSQNGSLQSHIFEILNRYAGELPIELLEDFDDNQTNKWKVGRINRTNLHMEILHESAEDIFYEVGMNAECDANRCIQQQEKYDLSKRGSDYIPLKQYLSIMRRSDFDIFSSIGCALNLMDSGLLAMNLDLSASRDAVECILKAGELSTFVLPRRLSVFVPALSTVEREFAKVASEKGIAISRFIDYLQTHCYQQDAADSPEDVRLLQKLRKSKVSLLYMYIVGQSFQDWDVDLLTKEDRRSHGVDERGNFSPEKYNSWVTNELKRRHYYNYCAKMFLQNENIQREKSVFK